ncbi:MAG: hypothetical protein IT369_02985 [Candidatus Latescibacteria bacterium]|nr:hypothetical protein [Candidatus Latescibacterota bacterium]
MPPMDLYLLIGQSNMAGRGRLEEVEPLCCPGILMDRDDTWQTAMEPLHRDIPRAGIGLGMSFARQLADLFPGRSVGLLPCAVGGTPLSRWEPGADLYQHAVATARAASQAGTLRGILWHQGENDALDEGLANSYFDRFTAMVAALRAELGAPQLPLLVGELGPFLSDDERFGHPSQINQALARAALALPLCGLVSAAGLDHDGDQVHFSALGLRELGRRYAEAFLELEHRRTQFPRLQGDLALVKDRLCAVLRQTPDLAAVRGWLDSLGTNGSWPDLDYTDQDRTTWRAPAHLHRLVALAQARATAPGDEALHRALLAGLDHWLAADYLNPNWWWNQIGVPGALSQLALLMEADLSAAQRAKVLEILHRAQLGMTGQNLVWVADITLRRGLLEQDPEVVGRAFAAVAGVIEVSAAEGIQADYSFHQHGPCLYSHGYGAAFAQDGARLVVLAAGTGFAFDQERVELLTSLVLDGHQWLSRGHTPDYGAIGRQTARPDQHCGYLAGVARNLLELPTGREAELQALLAHLDGEAGPPLAGNRHFWRSDTMAHHRPAFYTSARMFSDRLLNTDRPCNGEALWSHHIADGCNLILCHGAEYRDLFPLWDWQKIPGTTVAQAPQLEGEVCRRGSRSFAGGVSDGRYGLAAFDFERDGLQARKAWAFFDEGFACLGAGISYAAAHPVITTLNQCALRSEVVVSVGGQRRTLGAGTHRLENPDWVHHDQIAYGFPQPCTVQAEIGPRTGSWRDISISGSPDPITAECFSLWLDHGASPRDATYAYWVRPGLALGQIQTPPLRLLANRPQLQAIQHPALKLSAVCFYEAGRIELPEGHTLAVDHACLVLLQEGAAGWVISVSSPAHLPLHLEVSFTAAGGAPQVLELDLPGGLEAGRSRTHTLPPAAKA